MKMEAVLGERKAAANVQADLRAGSYSELIVNDVGLGRYFEAARNGRLFLNANNGFTVVAANAGALSATFQPIAGFANPPGSSKAAVILQAITQTRSGTPAGPFYLQAALSSAAISSAAAGTIIDPTLRNLVSSMVASANRALTGYVLSGVAALQLPIGGPAAAAAGAGQYGLPDELAGLVIIPPGGVCGIGASGAGTTHIVDAALIWAEIDWPL